MFSHYPLWLLGLGWMRCTFWRFWRNFLCYLTIYSFLLLVIFHSRNFSFLSAIHVYTFSVLFHMFPCLYDHLIYYNYLSEVFSSFRLNRLISYAKECLGEYQSGFRKRRSTTEQLSVITRIIEKKYEYHQNMWQMFVDFRKPYDSIYRNNTME